ncbi:MAG: DUF4142 domain-containing protein [Xanthobacteraceae bacterium]|nr:DUF4142 domain-containing protein [Xanthobacteraceae bacterium]
MKRILALVAATTLLSGAAFAQSVSEKTGVNSVLGIAPATQDFVKEAATSDMLEIQAAQIAQQKGNASEQKFAAQMIADHTKTTNDIKGLIASGAVKAELPTALDSSSQKKLDDLKAAKPEYFAATYDPMQVSAHKDAVSLFERYAKGGDNAKLKDWAGKTLPALQHHLDMAQQMNDARRNATVGSSTGGPASSMDTSRSSNAMGGGSTTAPAGSAK